MVAPENLMFFPQPSTGDRRDFEVNVGGDELIVFKSLALTTVSVAKKDLKNALEKIIEDLDLNLKQVQMKSDDLQETKQKIYIVKNFINRIDSTNKQNIEKQLETHQSITKLIEDQLQADIIRLMKTLEILDSEDMNQILQLEKENCIC